ncbi:molybdate ABC transporter substrate-binding protein [Methanoculleus sp. FWC-SCC1]|uniref:Molybdate ABC transporter substrate-binding protein n=1 Tax=Methanoculleus frigidifontis TaxID=2584085 RepID=A0ABT8M9U4_9EURY|nr:molybdate ABC transporter substrate-binding protein [Methanoculleus sp. FWC-SCC1]MDN7024708.1 molybdate ABC transporter substrate-binding protein [Methanoculleus sp. FWC-SCC1]
MQRQNILAILTLVLAGCILFTGCTGTQSTTVTEPADETLFVYSGAGLKAPMQEIGTVFGEKYGVTVEYTYAGSGALITQMELAQKGDVFIPGGTPDYAIAVNKGLVSDDPQYVAYHVPVIAVAKGNPKKITCVEDFTKSGVKVALGGINETAIGKAGDKLFKKHGIADAVEENVVLRAPTINELIVAMNMGTADATLITIDKMNVQTMEAIELPLEDNMALIVPIGTTTFTKKADLAGQYIDFVASDEGKAIFARHGFPTYPDPTYAGIMP